MSHIEMRDQIPTVMVAGTESTVCLQQLEYQKDLHWLIESCICF